MADTLFGSFPNSDPGNADWLLAERGEGGGAGVNLPVTSFLTRGPGLFWNTRGAGLITGDTVSSAALGAGTDFNTGGAGIICRGIASGFNPGGIEFLTGSGSTGAERMRIDAAGNVGIGNAPTTDRLKVVSSGNNTLDLVALGVASTLVCRKDNTTGGLALFFYGSSSVGTISTNGTSTAYNTSSDYRLKDDVRPVEGALGRLMSLKPVNFAWKVNGERADGFLAHEFGEVIPGAATGKKDATRSESHVDLDTGKTRTRKVPDYQGIDQSKAVPLLVAALQEARGLIEQLAARVDALENKPGDWGYSDAELHP